MWLLGLILYLIGFMVLAGLLYLATILVIIGFKFMQQVFKIKPEDLT